MTAMAAPSKHALKGGLSQSAAVAPALLAAVLLGGDLLTRLAPPLDPPCPCRSREVATSLLGWWRGNHAAGSDA